MSSGAKSELIAIERYTDPSDGIGAREWQQIAEMWAHVQWIGGGEGERQGALRELARYRFTVLTAAADEIGLGTEDRIVWSGERYNVREKPRRLPRLPDTEIIAETGVTQ